MTSSTFLGLSSVLLFSLAACGGGSANVEAKGGAEVEVFDFDRPLAEEKIDTENDAKQRKAMAALSDSAPSAAKTAATALVGARHDLRLAPTATQPSCECLAVVTGGATAPGLVWSGATPTLDTSSQMVIAIGSDGVACAKSTDGASASYKGYALEGNDVVVTVEHAKRGRPITHGAIIPRPTAGGQVFVKPHSKSTHFGRGLDGAARCAVGAGT